MQHFESGKWRALPQIQKQQHTLTDCKACIKYHFHFQSSFPIASNHVRGKHPNVLKDATNEAICQTLSGSMNVIPSVTAAREAAKSCYDTLNESFENIFKMPLVQALMKVKDLQIQPKLSKMTQKDSDDNREKMREAIQVHSGRKMKQ